MVNSIAAKTLLPRPDSRPPGENRFDLAQTRADLLDRFLLALLLMLPLFTGFRFMASWGTGYRPLRILYLPVMYLGIACLYLGRRRFGYQARVHILLGLVLGFWIQQVFLVGPMEPGTVAIAEIVPLAAGLFFSPRVGWFYLFGLMAWRRPTSGSPRPIASAMPSPPRAPTYGSR
jgi:hypothetical protein